MIEIGNKARAVAAAAKASMPGLIAGDRLQARVLGENRHGTAVQIGRREYQLDLPSRLADAKILTLEATGSSSATGSKVHVIEKDGLPLPKPIPADLAPRPTTSPQGASTIVQKGVIEVAARPVGPDGKTLGSSLILQLQVLASPEPIGTAWRQGPEPQLAEPAAGKAAAPDGRTSAPVSRPDEPRSPAPTPPQPAPGRNRSTGLAGSTSISSPSSMPPAPPASPPFSSQMASSVGVRTRMSVDQAAETTGEPSTSARDRPADRQIMSREPAAKTAAAPPLPSASAAWLKASPPSRPDTPIEARAPGAPSLDRRENAISSVPQDGGEPPARSTATLAASLYRQASDQGLGSVANAAPRASFAAGPELSGHRSDVVKAIVVGQSRTGTPILDAEGQLFQLERPVDLPLGTALEATLVARMAAVQAPVGRPDDATAPLSRLIQLLDEIDRAGRHNLDQDQMEPARRLPRPDRHLGASFLALMAGEKSASPDDGMQPASERNAATAAQRDQIRTLVRELGSIASEPLAEGWKGLSLPLGLDQNQGVYLYFRDHALDPDEPSSNADAEREEPQRAVFDVSFSRLGRCQIDVLCQSQRFDLVVRSGHSFPPDERQVMTSLFESACEISGMHGDIAFQVGSFFDVDRTTAGVQDFKT